MIIVHKINMATSKTDTKQKPLSVQEKLDIINNIDSTPDVPITKTVKQK